MTPKQKAKQLVERFRKELKIPSEYYDRAKQCALIAVDEIILSNPHSNPFNTSVYSTMEYWQEVKSEIPKRVHCDKCVNFIDNSNPVYEIGAKYNSKDYSCKLGKRVMFRMPKFTHIYGYNPINEYGWIRYCNEFKEN